MIEIFQTVEELNRFAAGRFVEIGRRAVETSGRFAVALAGGSTPKALYRLLTTAEFKDRLNWPRVRFFFGDERFVPADHPESNFRMAAENLFRPLEIAGTDIFRWRTELGDPDAAAADYRERLAAFFRLTAENPFPRFDLILLGMGADGHTASLFPFTEALGETSLTAVANPVEKLRTVRLTTTFPVLNNAAHVIFLVAGEEKAAVLREVLEGAPEPARLPSQNVRPTAGELLWLIDRNAAQKLSGTV
ncbi:MAG: 6-phosphogluconolactonase [Acidobacteria bacterium]|nr:6-phosphogluconolactonase [Acidobacteriota bacterium]